MTVVGAVFLLMAVRPTAGQAPAAAAKVPAPGQFPPYRAPRTADGRPDLNGIWQAFVTADIDVQDHDAQAGPRPDILGAYGAWPGGQGIVDGGEIPYKPEALAKKRENAEKRMVVNITSDPHRRQKVEDSLVRLCVACSPNSVPWRKAGPPSSGGRRLSYEADPCQ